ncbi:hypothetical protein FDUTEX481_09575 [Tolypothrix sp. PCC 7601]|nr:hypothetical protein FDUTEX481_09575 [Tolypothrix sp. PCC 7601]BAY91040.1 hypothetical protein NIES3275_30600 [Microchaete diplosiphon NIES-3275]
MVIPTIPNTCRLRAKGEGEKGQEKTFNPYPFSCTDATRSLLKRRGTPFPKPNSNLKILNRAVLPLSRYLHIDDICDKSAFAAVTASINLI